MAITRPLKEGSVTTYQAKVALGFPDILASEMDADLDTIYAAWNGGVNTANLVNGSVTFAKLAPDAQLWRDGGSLLTPGTNFASRSGVAVPGDATSAVLLLGTTTAKARVQALVGAPGSIGMFSNRNWPDNAQDDAANTLVGVLCNPSTDSFLVQRSPAGSTTQTTLLTLTMAGLALRYPSASASQHWFASGLYGTRFGINDRVAPDVPAWSSWSIEMDVSTDTCSIVRRAGGAAAGAGTALHTVDISGNLTIAGATATKAAPGTAWVNPSDPRLKHDVGPYDVGLDAITQLTPISFKDNGLGGTVDDGRVCHGFDTTAVAAVMPDCVGSQRVKLNPDDETETEIATMDVSDITLAFVNAFKELAARVTALEAR